eukprot:gene24451-biopygen5922
MQRFAQSAGRNNTVPQPPKRRSPSFPGHSLSPAEPNVATALRYDSARAPSSAGRRSIAPARRRICNTHFPGAQGASSRAGRCARLRVWPTQTTVRPPSPAADPVAPPRPAERHHPRPPSPAAEDPPPERRPPPTQPSRRTHSTQGCGYTRDPGGRANIKALPAPKAPGK